MLPCVLVVLVGVDARDVVMSDTKRSLSRPNVPVDSTDISQDHIWHLRRVVDTKLETIRFCGSGEFGHKIPLGSASDCVPVPSPRSIPESHAVL